MKNLILFAGALLMLASCSAPKYAYHFDTYDYNAGKKKATTTNEVVSAEVSPLLINEASLVAEAQTTPVTPSEKKPLAQTMDRKALEAKVKSMSKEEKQELKQDLKNFLKELKKIKKEGKNGQGVDATKAMDHDLKLALIFGVVAILLTAFYGISPVFWILGLISLVIAVVFFIQWLARQ
jgi:CHASE3 domain sensor protein